MSSFAVVIINYNTRELLRRCLRSVLPEAPDEVIVADNGSVDGSAEMVKRDFPGVRLHLDRSNPGYGGASNAAIKQSDAPYVLLLNSDTLLRAGAMAELSRYLDQHPLAAIVGPRLLNRDGSLQPSCFPFPTPLNTLLVKGNLGRAIRYGPVIRDRYLRTWRHDRPRKVPWVRGAALALRREAFAALDGFDESFFMYFEEVDLCRRAWNAGWEVHFAPGAEILHVGGASTVQRRTEMTVRMFDSSMQFHRRYTRGVRLAALAAAERAIVASRLVIDTARLCATRDADARAGLRADLAAWRQILFGGRRAIPAPSRGTPTPDGRVGEGG